MKQFLVKPLPLRLCLLLAIILPSQEAILASASRAESAQIAGRYKVVGNTIQHTITIPAQPPVAVIVVQYLPPGTQVVSANPAYSNYDQTTGEVKWLFKSVSPGPLHIRLNLAHEVGKDKIRAEALFKDGAGDSSTYVIAPQPMKRKAIEGC